MGCSLAILSVIAFCALIGGCIVFAESGADNGRVTLETAADYPAGWFEHVDDDGFYLVRLLDGRFVAISDRGVSSRETRCGIALVAGEQAAPVLARQANRLSPDAVGSAILLSESCTETNYDLAGVRIESDGRNADRFPVRTREDGRLEVDTSSRLCSERAGNEFRREVRCPR